MTASTSFGQVFSMCRKALGDSPEVRRVPKIKLDQAALDIAIVAVGVRSGYLVDTLALRNKKRLEDLIGELLATLRQQCDVFKRVSAMHDSASEQVFIVNVFKLKTYWDPTHEGLSPTLPTWVTFIELDGSGTKLSSPPPGLPKVFQDILSRLPDDTESPSLIHLPEDDTRNLGDIVALAACLLEFPVAYVPTGDGSDPFLAGVPLDVYECVLVQNMTLRPEHVMVKFSCPQATAADVSQLQSDALVQRLRERFTERLERVAFPGTLVIRHHVETKDRVAL